MFFAQITIIVTMLIKKEKGKGEKKFSRLASLRERGCIN